MTTRSLVPGGLFGVFQNCAVCCGAFVAALIVIAAIVVLLLLRPNPPPDYARIPLVDDQAWNELTSQGWQWTQSAAAANMPPRIAERSEAPVSPVNVLAMNYDGTDRDSAPVTFWHTLPSATRIYYEFSYYMTPNWECSPAGCGKISFVFPASGGDAYIGVYCKTDPAGTGACPGPFTNNEMIIGGQLQFDAGANYPLGVPILANKTKTPIYAGRWYQIAVFHQWSSTPTANDGIWRIWVDGILNLELTDVKYSIPPAIEFQYSMTRQVPPVAPGQEVYVDNTILRADNGVIRRVDVQAPPADRSRPMVPLP